MKFVIVTNNPKVRDDLGSEFEVDFADITYREVLCKVRDMIYEGHKLLTHPLSGSVKPNETPYKSVIVSMVPHQFDSQQAEIIANAIAVFDKFKPIGWELNERILRDFQLIDYTLLAGAIGFDATAGLSKKI